MLHALQPHMFTASQYSNNEKRRRQTEYSPVEADSLFWCLFIIKYGKEEYDAIPEHRRKNREMDEKGRIIDFLSKAAAATANKIKEDKKKSRDGKKRQEMIAILSAEHSGCSLIPAICSYYEMPLASTVIRGAGAQIVKYSVSVAAESVIYVTTK